MWKGKVDPVKKLCKYQAPTEEQERKYGAVTLRNRGCVYGEFISIMHEGRLPE